MNERTNKQKQKQKQKKKRDYVILILIIDSLFLKFMIIYHFLFLWNLF